MKRSRFILSPEALADLDQIWLFIAADSIDAAERNEERLRSAMNLIGQKPNIGHARPDITPRLVTFWPVGAYLIVYSPDKDPMRDRSRTAGIAETGKTSIDRFNLQDKGL